MTTPHETAIKALVDDRIEAIRTKDRARLLASYAPQVLTFDVVPPLQNVGSDGVSQKLEQWFGGYQGPITWDLRDLKITASESVAFAHALVRSRGTLKSGDTVDMWFRFTCCFATIDGAWKIVHEHTSDPLDPKSGQGLTDLKPE